MTSSANKTPRLTSSATELECDEGEAAFEGKVRRVANSPKAEAETEK